MVVGITSRFARCCCSAAPLASMPYLPILALGWVLHACCKCNSQSIINTCMPDVSLKDHMCGACLSLRSLATLPCASKCTSAGVVCMPCQTTPSCCVQVYFNDVFAHVIRKLDLDSYIYTIAAGILSNSTGLGAIEYPSRFAVSPTTGEMYISSQYTHQLYRLVPEDPVAREVQVVSSLPGYSASSLGFISHVTYTPAGFVLSGLDSPVVWSLGAVALPPSPTQP